MPPRPWFSYRRSAFQIELDYPIDPKPRYGYGKPVHPALYERIEQNRHVYRSYENVEPTGMNFPVIVLNPKHANGALLHFGDKFGAGRWTPNFDEL